MSRGYFMRFEPLSASADQLEFRVLASGWDSGISEIVEVGKMVLNVQQRTATFFTSDPWQNNEFAEPFTDRPLAILDSYGLWTRWLLELGEKALAGSQSLVRFV